MGDKKNDHRGYTVVFDSKTYKYNGTSACGGAFGQTCEEQRPCIKFLASNLAEGNHTIKLSNNPNGPAQTNVSYFGTEYNFLSTFSFSSKKGNIIPKKLTLLFSQIWIASWSLYHQPMALASFQTAPTRSLIRQTLPVPRQEAQVAPEVEVEVPTTVPHRMHCQ